MLSKLVKNIGLFIVGFLISVSLIYRGQVITLLNGFSGGHSLSKSYEGDYSNVASAYASQVNLKLPENSFGDVNYVEDMLASIEIGTSFSLQKIRLERVSQLKDYEQKMLPKLKEKALTVLLSRFTQVDWAVWPQTSFSNQGRQTSARLFVDDLLAINKPIGRYLEISAQLLHGLYRRTLSGQFYDVGKDFKYVLDHAETLINRLDLLTPARLHFDQDILNDQIFLSVLEKERCNQVIRYIKSNPLGAPKYFSLISSLEPRYCEQKNHKVIASLVQKFAIYASPKLRQKICQDEIEARVLRKFAILNPVIRKNLSGLYLIAAMDALETGGNNTSARFLEESMDIEEGLQGQSFLLRVLQTKLSKSNNRNIIQKEELPSDKDTEIKGFLKSLRDDIPVEIKDHGEISYLGTSLILFIFVGFMLFLINFVNRFNKKRIGNIGAFGYLTEVK